MSSWERTVAAAHRAATALAEAVQHMPPGTPPTAAQAKALRRATGIISGHAGTLKKALGIGTASGTPGPDTPPATPAADRRPGTGPSVPSPRFQEPR